MKSRGKQNNIDGKKSEDKSVKIYGHKTPGSGSGDSKLDIIGDGPFDGLRGENKWTGAMSRSIKVEELEKARIQASKHSVDWFFILDFNHLFRYAMCSETYWIGIHDYVKDLEARYESLKEYIQRLDQTTA